jgi:hypothetical protein
VIELTVLLAALDIVWPVARVSLLAVKKTSDAKLLGGGSVPAGPVAGARGLVSENTIQPVAVLSGNGWIYKKKLALKKFFSHFEVFLTGELFAFAVVSSPGVVATLGYTTVLAGVDEAVGAVKELRLSTNALPVSVAVCLIRDDAAFDLTRVQLTFARCLLLLLLRQTFNTSKLILVISCWQVKFKNKVSSFLILLKAEISPKNELFIRLHCLEVCYTRPKCSFLYCVVVTYKSVRKQMHCLHNTRE